MGYIVKGTTRTKFEPGRSVTGKANKAAHCWLWELCKVGRVASWTYTKGEGFRVAWDEATHRTYSGREEWGTLDTLTSDQVLERCATLDPAGDYLPAAPHAEVCRKVLEPAPAKKARTTVAQLRQVLDELASLDLPADARRILEAVS